MVILVDANVVIDYITSIEYDFCIGKLILS